MSKNQIDPIDHVHIVLPRLTIHFELPRSHFKAIQEIARKRSCSADVIFQEAVEAYVKHEGYPEKSSCHGPDVTMDELYAEAVEFYLEHRKQIQ